MSPDRLELELLRVSLARIAQTMRLDAMIPGAPAVGAPYEILRECAKLDWGWNVLVAEIIHKEQL